jgi:hypothetical protein
MNILLVHPDPMRSARLLNGPHLRKQAIECLQMVSVSCLLHGWPQPIALSGEPYKPTHEHHPVTRWVCRGLNETQWTSDYAHACAYEASIRSQREHACVGQCLRLWEDWDDAAVPEGYPPEEFIFCGTNRPTFYGSLEGVVEAYRQYLREDKGYTLEELPEDF